MTTTEPSPAPSTARSRHEFAKAFARLAGDVGLLALVLFVMHHNGAPFWALALAVYVGTRNSRVDTAVDKAATQSTIRHLVGSVDGVHSLLTTAIAAKAKENEERGS